MSNIRWIGIIILLYVACLMVGCAEKPITYGREMPLELPGAQRQIWAVAPVINLSGQPGVDPLLQADLLYQQLQTVKGLTVIPVDQVAKVYAANSLEKVETVEQARAVTEALGCDALIVGTVTQFDPYNPPKFGGSLVLFEKNGSIARQPPPDPRALLRAGAPPEVTVLPTDPQFLQSVGMYDAANGSVRDAVIDYATGRHEPTGPMGNQEYFRSMDRFCGFAYCSLVEQLLVQLQNGR